MAFKLPLGKSTPAPEPEDQGPPSFSDKDQATARKWFKHGDSNREKLNYDYAIESYIQGLGYWPEAVEEGHRPLRSIAIQRQQAGGKKPGMMDKMKKGTGGKDHKQAMLNAEWLVSMDPTDEAAWDALIKNLAKCRYVQTLIWAAPLGLESLKRDKKPSNSRFKAFRDHLSEAAGVAIDWKQSRAATQILEVAMESVDFLMSRSPGDDALRDEQRNLAGRLAIAKGNYEEADSFRDSLQDAAAQKNLQDAERGGRQEASSLAQTIASLRKAWEAEPTSSAVINRYIEALTRTEQIDYENEAIQVLTDLAERTQQYSHKVRADNIVLAQKKRELRALRDRAHQPGAGEDDKRNFRLAAQDFQQSELAIQRERVQKYPTDLKVKYALGRALFATGDYQDAIPILQDAQADPRVRHRCLLLIGQAFQQTGAPTQAVSVLKEAIDSYEMNDDLSKELLYRLGIACEAAGDIAGAKDALGKLLRIDYNYGNGDARKRMDDLNNKG